MSIRVLLAEGQASSRSALRLLLEQEQDLDIVGETAWAGDLLTQVRLSMPDTLLLDWALPGLSGKEMLPALRALHPYLRVIALSGRPEIARDVLAAGADAFVSKVEPPEQLLMALRIIGGKR